MASREPKFGFMYIGVRMAYEIETHKLIFGIKNYYDEIFIDEICHLYKILKFVVSACAVLSWLRLFRFISFNRTMLNFSIALRKGYSDIVGFSVMFFIVFIAFAAMGLLIFCKTNPDFATFDAALITMMRMTMTDFQYDHLEKADSIFGPLFFLFYILFVFFILLNTFLAVISENYVTATSKRRKRFGTLKYLGLHIVHSLRYWFSKLKCKRNIPETKKIMFEPPRLLNKGQALQEFFGDIAKDEPGTVLTEKEFESLESSGLLERQKDQERLHGRIRNIEGAIEDLIDKMDHILQRVELMISEKNNQQTK